jgi:hypothetical protein
MLDDLTQSKHQRDAIEQTSYCIFYFLYLLKYLEKHEIYIFKNIKKRKTLEVKRYTAHN